MPRFHFHTRGGLDLSDEEGVDLSSLAAAKDEAVQLLAESLRNSSSTFWRTEEFSVIVTDDRGGELFVLDLTARTGPVLHQQRRA